MVNSEWEKGRSDEELEGVGHAGRVPGRLEDRDECTERASEATPARAATERARRKPNYEAVYRASLVRPAAPRRLSPLPPSRPRHVTSRHSPRLSFFSPSLESQPIEPRAPSPMRERNGQTQRQRELTHAGARVLVYLPSFSFRQSAALLMPKFIFGRRRTADNFLGDIIIVVVLVVVVEVL